MSDTEIKIKKALLDARVKQIDIARKLRITRQVVNGIVTGRHTSKRVKKAIAKATGRRVEDLWPTNNKRKAA